MAALATRRAIKAATARVQNRCMVVWRRWRDSGYPKTTWGSAAHECLNLATFAYGYADEAVASRRESYLRTAREKLAAAKEKLRIAERRAR
jgi:hypothetical protein